ncbi:MAG TPA: DUF1800 domain-containing protein [Fimbriimonadaceae bacterium]|jgi:uncharacterized protein (DUF1800 family)
MELRTDRDKIAHLLRRFGLGASENEVDFYSKGGLKGAIDALLNYESVPDTQDIPVKKFQSGKNSNVKMPGLQAWWVAKLLTTQRPLQEKMTLFWHNHFATSAAKVLRPAYMYQQNEVLRANCTGKFQDLLSATSKDPAMLLWLDNQFNVAGRANENFAREVMELFTLGIGHYTEKDIQESARAFTGWAFRNAKTDDTDLGNKGRTAEFFFRERLHDGGAKKFLGNEGNFNGDDILGILCGNPQTSRFVAKKFWTWFGYSDPEPQLVEHLASTWYKSGMDIKVLIRTVMESDEFYTDKAYRHVFKNPADFVIAPMRQLGIGAQLASATQAEDLVQGVARTTIAAAQQTMKNMGMPLFFPPDVSGWAGGENWISSATMVERMSFGPTLFSGTQASQRIKIHYDPYPLFQNDLRLESVVDKLLSIMDATLSEDKRRALNHCALELSQGAVTQQNAADVSGQICRLIFSCPEYQLC